MAKKTQFDKFLDRALKKMKYIADASALEAGSDITRMSPVDKGTFRASWWTSTDDSGYELSPKLTRKPLEALETTLNGTPLGGTIYYVNPQPYSGKLEYGHSKQAPNGMVRVTVANFGQIIKQKIKEADNVKF